MQTQENKLISDKDTKPGPTKGRAWTLLAIALVIAAYLVAGYVDQPPEATHQPGAWPASEQGD